MASAHLRLESLQHSMPTTAPKGIPLQNMEGYSKQNKYQFMSDNRRFSCYSQVRKASKFIGLGPVGLKITIPSTECLSVQVEGLQHISYKNTSFSILGSLLRSALRAVLAH